MRFNELTDRVERAEYKAKVWRILSNRRTVLRKEITSLLASPDSRARNFGYTRVLAFTTRLDRLREMRPKEEEHFESIIQLFEALRDEIETLMTMTRGVKI